MAVVISFSSLFQVGFISVAFAESKQSKQDRRDRKEARRQAQINKAQYKVKDGKVVTGSVIKGFDQQGEPISVFVPDVDTKSEDTQESLSQIMIRILDSDYKGEATGPFKTDLNPAEKETFKSMLQLANQYDIEKAQANVSFFQMMKAGLLTPQQISQVDPADPNNPAGYRNPLEILEGGKLDLELRTEVAAKKYYSDKAKNEALARQIILDKKVSRVLRDQSRRFPIDTAMFFVVIGSIIATELMMKSGGDPMAMQRHFEALTDPVAHLSFYSFMAANGIALDWLQKGAHKRLIEANHRLLFANLPLISMPFASIISQLVGDGALLIKMCASEVMNPSLRQKEKEKTGVYYTACEETLRTWRFANRANLMIPQIISLTLGNIPVFYGLYKMQPIADKTGIIMLRESNLFMSRMANATVSFGMRFLASPVVGLTIGIGILDPVVMRLWTTHSDDIRIRWNEFKVKSNIKSCREEINDLKTLTSNYKTRGSTCRDLREDLIALRDRNISWRSIINSDFETSFAGWSEVMHRVTNQKFAAQGMYEYVYTRLHDYYSFWRACQTEKDDEKRQISCKMFNEFFARSDRFQLTRPFELLGFDVDRREYKSKGELPSIEDHKMRLGSGLTLETLETERKQQRFLLSKTKEFLQNVQHADTIKFDLDHWAKIQQVLEQFVKIIDKEPHNIRKQRVHKAWVELENLTSRLGQQYREHKQYYDMIIEFKRSLGNPNPKTNIGDGFLWAISESPSMRDRKLISDSHVASYKYNYVFPTTAHYFLHEMICGGERASVINGFDFGESIGKLWQSFSPPRLTKANSKNYLLCNPQMAPDQKNYELRFESTKANSNNGREINPMMYLLANFDSGIFTYTEKDGVRELDHPRESFASWWEKAIELDFEKFLHDSQVEWGGIYADLIASFNNLGYVQDQFQRKGIIQHTKGNITDKSTQEKNPLDVISKETPFYFDTLYMLNEFRLEKTSQEQRAAIVHYQQTQKNVLKFLKNVFENVNHADEATAIKAAAGPDITEAMALLNELSEAMGELKDAFVGKENSPVLKDLASDTLYSLEGSNTDLSKYLMSAFVVNQANNEQAQKMIKTLQEKSKGQIRGSGSKGYNLRDKGG